MKCDSIERGCKWKGTVATLEEHVATCDFTPVPCPKECKEGSSIRIIIRRKLGAHLKEECVNRDHECKHCGKKDTYGNITDIHDNVCKKKMILCTSAECTQTIERGKMDAHLKNDCEYTQMSCKYESIGCDERVKRKDLKTHEQDDSHHLQKALEAIAVLKEEKVTLKRGKSIFIKFANFKTKKDNSEIFSSSSFYVGLEGYHMDIKIHPHGDGKGKGTHVSVYARFLRGKYDHKLSWPFVGTITCTLLNQLADENHLTRKLVEPEDGAAHELHVGESLGFPQFISHEELSTDDVKHLMNDTLYFKITAEAASEKSWLEPE